MDKAKYLMNRQWIFERIINFLLPIEIEPEERSKRIFTGLVVIVTIPIAFLFSFLSFSAADYLLGSFLFIVGIVVTVSLIIGRNLEDARRLYRLNMVLVGILLLYLIGMSGPHPNYVVWAFIYPVEVFYLLGLLEGSLFSSVFYILSIWLILFQDLFHGTISYDNYFKRDFLITLLIISLIAYFFERVKNGYEQGLKQRQLILEEEKSKLKVARDNLFKLGEKLENKVSERTERLSKANTQLREEIEERSRFEKALRKSEERYRLHFENASDAIYTINRDLKVETLSPSAVNILGLNEEEVVGKSILELHVLAPEYRKKAVSEITRALDGEQILASEYEFITADGNRLFAEISGSPLIKNGEVIGMVSVARDITDRRKAEEERAGLEKMLMRAQKMEAIGTLAGGVAHDFNNLLMGIQGRTSLMLLDIELSHPHFVHLKGIEDYVSSAVDLTKQLLGFARGGKYDVKIVNLNDIVKVSSQMFGRTKKEIRIHMKLEPDLWATEADEKQIEQVLLNLYINAWQAMIEGGELYLQTENVRMEENYAAAHQVKTGKYVRISVTDTGVGMDEETLLRIFDPFFTTKEMGRGTGLGLASAYGIIKNHDGTIDVYSEKGHGTTFVINLPASEKEVPRKKDLSGELLKGAGAILLVDDEELILDVGKPILEKLGYRVMVAKGGREAVDLYRQKPDEIDMVILDMIMPDKGGGETFDRLKEIDPNVKVILSSGYSADGEAKNILSRGCDGFIQKPFKVKKLSQKIKEILDKD